MNPLALRKQLLIAESELNRARLVHDWQMMATEARALTKQARTISSLASVAASLAAGLVSFRRKKPATAIENPSWWQTILKGAQVVGSVWSQFRSQDRH
jgi:hypothetical protein